jgi:hypothetical protein
LSPVGDALTTLDFGSNDNRKTASHAPDSALRQRRTESSIYALGAFFAELAAFGMSDY